MTGVLVPVGAWILVVVTLCTLPEGCAGSTFSIKQNRTSTHLHDVMLRRSLNFFTVCFYLHFSVCLHSARKTCTLPVPDFVNVNLSGSGLSSSNKFVIPSVAVDLSLFALFVRNNTTVTRINNLHLLFIYLFIYFYVCVDTRGKKKKRTSKKNVDGRCTSSHEKRHLEADQWLNRKEWCLGSGRRRQLSQDRKDR